jgi:RNA polymerase sigma factor (sigma-70 family)
MPLSHLSQRKIVQELKNGSRVGYRRLNELYQSRLLREAKAAYRLLHEDAEELVNDVLLSVTERITGFEFKNQETDFHRWVMTIFRNRVRDHARRKALTRGLKSNFDEALFEDDALASEVEKEVIAWIIRSYEETATGKEDSRDQAVEVVGEVLERLETWEQVLLKCRALGLPYEEIARYTGKSSKQLKVYHARVMKKFLRLLDTEHPGFLDHARNHKEKQAR